MNLVTCRCGQKFRNPYFSEESTAVGYLLCLDCREKLGESNTDNYDSYIYMTRRYLTSARLYTGFELIAMGEHDIKDIEHE